MIGERLKEERELLGLTQPQFAEAAGAAKRTLIDWEKGATAPNAVQLSALREIGVDVLYVLTGERNPTHAMRRGVQLAQQRLNQQQQSMKQAIGLLQSGGGMPVPPAPASQASALTADEVLLLERYRTSPPLLREAALRVLNQVPVDQGAEG